MCSGPISKSIKINKNDPSIMLKRLFRLFTRSLVLPTVVSRLEDCRFDSRPLQSAFPGALEQDAEPQLLPVRLRQYEWKLHPWIRVWTWCFKACEESSRRQKKNCCQRLESESLQTRCNNHHQQVFFDCVEVFWLSFKWKTNVGSWSYRF